MLACVHGRLCMYVFVRPMYIVQVYVYLISKVEGASMADVGPNMPSGEVASV